MKKVLVTGAAGFIGSHVCETLVRRGYEVRAFYRYNGEDHRGWLEDLPTETAKQIEYFAGDIRDSDSVARAMEGMEGVLNLAALIAIPYSYQAPRSYIDTNVTGAINVLQAARKNQARVIQTSTSEVYGTAQFVPITEKHPMNAQSPYAASKVASDQMALACGVSFEIPVTVLRPFNTYGPRQSSRAVIPTIISQILAGKTKIRLGALTPTRDLTYAEDTAEGFVKALESDAAIGKTVQLGTGFEISIQNLAQLIAQEMKTSVEFESDPARVRPAGSEVERLLSDPALAATLLGWRPKKSGETGLRDGIAKTCEWMKERYSNRRIDTGYRV